MTSRPSLAAHPWLRVAISVALVGLLIALLPKDRLWRALHEVNAAIVLAALPLYLLIHFIGALKWRLLVNQAAGRLALLRAVQYYFAGLFGNLFLPSIVGGDMVMVGVAIREGETSGSVLIGSFLNRALDVLALVLLTGAGAALMPRHMTAESRRIWNLVLLVSAFTVVVAGSAALLIRPSRLPAPLRNFAAKHAEAFAILRRPWLVALPLALSLFTQTGFTALTAWIASSTGLDLPFSVWLFTWSLAKVVALVPVTISGIGTREIALVTLLRPFGIASAPALVIGLAWDAILIAGGLAAGLISTASAWAAPAIHEGARN